MEVMVNEDVAPRLIESLRKMANAEANAEGDGNISETERCMVEFTNLLRAAQQQITNEGVLKQEPVYDEQQIDADWNELLQLTQQAHYEQQQIPQEDMTDEWNELLQLTQHAHYEQKQL